MGLFENGDKRCPLGQKMGLIKSEVGQTSRCLSETAQYCT